MKYIKDIALEPFHLIVDEYGFSLKETVVPDTKYTNNPKPYIQDIGFYSNLPSVLKKVIYLKVCRNLGEQTDLKTYIKEYKNITNLLSKIFEEYE